MKKVMLALAMFCGMIDMAYAEHHETTRGIGQYPGLPSQFTAPKMVKDFTYRNIALNRAVYTSSNADFNLTGQLVTDGMVTTAEPAFLSVRTNGGEVPNRDKEKLIDGNIHSSFVLMGEKAFVEFDWSGMTVKCDTLRFDGELAYHQSKVGKGYVIRVLASRDGKMWKTIGVKKEKGLPGVATEQLVSSDPNKFQDIVSLPLRKITTEVPLDKKGEYAHIRVEFEMLGATWWRIYEIGTVAWMPSSHFSSVWQSAPSTSVKKANEQWLYVDLGTDADFDEVILHWVYAARCGKVQVSDDATNWKNIAHIGVAHGGVERIVCKAHGRYVRLLLTQPDDHGVYALSEMQVMGKGGLHAEASNTLPSDEGKQMLNQWKLRREGSQEWIEATVPGTVLTSYMNIGAIPDNRYADNMRQISESFFNSDFWYKTNVAFRSASNKQQRTYLNFDGINWKAEVMLNGQKIGRIDGAFIRARFDVTDMLKDGNNLLELHVIKNAHFGAVKQKNFQSTDLNGGILGADNPTFHASIGWDWMTSTPGREMGIWNDVYLSHDLGVRVCDPLVTTTLDYPDTLASVTPSVFVQNEENVTREIILKGCIGDVSFEKIIRLQPMEKREERFLPNDYPQLRKQSFRLWWPNGYGTPYLYDAEFCAIDASTNILLSQVKYKAGIRELSYKDLDTQAKIYVNGKRLNPLGGNWGFSETNLNYRGREYDVAVRYHKEMNYNMIRNWVGQIGDEEFYAACDKYGIMVWQDFWLANPWDGPDPYNEKMFLANSWDYISRVRNHACMGIYVGRNEGFPPKTLDEALRSQIKALHPQLGYIPSSADLGVSGHGPYRMMSSTYYFNNQSHLLHSERGMPNVPSYESLCRMIPKEHLWPQGDAWGQHDYTLQGAQGGESFNAIMEKHFGVAHDAKQFTKWAQWLNYDGYRAMYESAEQNRMGLLIWMSHSCWPSMVWCTYDYYFEPTAAYFGVKKACEPLHIQYNPAKRQVEVVNYAGGAKDNLLAQVQIFNMYGKMLREESRNIVIEEDQTKNVLNPILPGDDVYYIKLKLVQKDSVVSENFYVQGKEEDNFLALSNLQAPTLRSVASNFSLRNGEWHGCIEVRNESEVPALLIRLNLKRSDGEQILPVIYSDNYFSLMPHERKVIRISYREEDCMDNKPRIEVSAFNQ